MKTQRYVLFLLFFPLATLWPQKIGLSPWPDSLVIMIERLSFEHPSVLAASAEKEATRSRRSQARMWEPPTIGIDWFQMPGRWIPNPSRNRETDYFIQQMIPWPGKNSAMENTVMAEVDMKAALLEERISRLARDLKFLFIDWISVRQQIHFNRLQQSLLERYLTFLESKTTDLVVREILMIRNELAMTQIDGLRLKQMLDQVTAEWLALTGRPIISFPVDTFALPEELPGNAETWFKMALQYNPSFKVMENESRMYRQEAMANRLMLYPDVMVRLMYKVMPHDSENAWSFMAGFTVPVMWWSKKGIDAKVTEKNWFRRKAESNRTAMAREVQAKLYQIAQGLATNRLIQQQYRQWMHNSQMQIQLLASGAFRDPMTASEIFETERQMLRLRRERVMLESEYMRQVAELEWLTGLSLPHWGQ